MAIIGKNIDGFIDYDDSETTDDKCFCTSYIRNDWFVTIQQVHDLEPYQQKRVCEGFLSLQPKAMTHMSYTDAMSSESSKDLFDEQYLLPNDLIEETRNNSLTRL